MSEVITIKFEGDLKEKIQQAFRDVLVFEFGGMWEEYCFQNGIAPEIKLGFLDFMNQITDQGK